MFRKFLETKETNTAVIVKRFLPEKDVAQAIAEVPQDSIRYGVICSKLGVDIESKPCSTNEFSCVVNHAIESFGNIDRPKGKKTHPFQNKHADEHGYASMEYKCENQTFRISGRVALNANERAPLVALLNNQSDDTFNPELYQQLYTRLIEWKCTKGTWVKMYLVWVPVNSKFGNPKKYIDVTQPKPELTPEEQGRCLYYDGTQVKN